MIVGVNQWSWVFFLVSNFYVSIFCGQARAGYVDIVRGSNYLAMSGEAHMMTANDSKSNRQSYLKPYFAKEAAKYCQASGFGSLHPENPYTVEAAEEGLWTQTLNRDKKLVRWQIPAEPTQRQIKYIPYQGKILKVPINMPYESYVFTKIMCEDSRQRVPAPASQQGSLPFWRLPNPADGCSTSAIDPAPLLNRMATSLSSQDWPAIQQFMPFRPVSVPGSPPTLSDIHTRIQLERRNPLFEKMFQVLKEQNCFSGKQSNPSKLEKLIDEISRSSNLVQNNKDFLLQNARKFRNNTGKISLMMNSYERNGQTFPLLFPIQVAFNGKIFIQLEKCGDLLGEGKLKHVSRAIDVESGDVVANLRMPVTSPVSQREIERELVLNQKFRNMRGLAHPILADFYDDHGVKTYVLQQPLQDGSLISIRQGDATLSVKEHLQVGEDVLQGLNSLHGLNYIHRDMKPANILYKRSPSGVHAIISDFDTVVDQEELANVTGAKGSAGYMAPEIMMNLIQSGIPYVQGSKRVAAARKADVFGAGLSLFEAYMNRAIFGEAPLARAFKSFQTANVALHSATGKFLKPNLSPTQKENFRREAQRDFQKIVAAYEELSSHVGQIPFRSAAEKNYASLLIQMMEPRIGRRPSSAQALSAFGLVIPHSH